MVLRVHAVGRLRARDFDQTVRRRRDPEMDRTVKRRRADLDQTVKRAIDVKKAFAQEERTRPGIGPVRLVAPAPTRSDDDALEIEVDFSKP